MCQLCFPFKSCFITRYIGNPTPSIGVRHQHDLWDRWEQLLDILVGELKLSKAILENPQLIQHDHKKRCSYQTFSLNVVPIQGNLSIQVQASCSRILHIVSNTKWLTNKKNMFFFPSLELVLPNNRKFPKTGRFYILYKNTGRISSPT